MRCARQERSRRFLPRHRGRLAWHVVLGNFQLPLVLLRTARARDVLWEHFPAPSVLPCVSGAQSENTVLIWQGNPVHSANLESIQVQLELYRKAHVYNVVQANSLQQEALHRMKHVLIVAEANTPTRAAMVQSPSANPVPRGSFQQNLGQRRSFRASTAPQERFRWLLAANQRTIV